MTSRKATLLAIPIVLLGLVAWLVFGILTAPASTETAADLGDPTVEELADGSRGVAANAAGSRESADAGAARASLVDPNAAYDAALSGFRGRLVDERKQPLAAKIVRFYRIDPEVLQARSIFADLEDEEDSAAAPKVQVHDTESGADGTFEVTGAWPHAFYILEADAEGDHRYTVPVERVPGPGEIVDLGDIVLKQLGTIVGRVVGRGGRPVSDVMIRAMDVPGMVLEVAPFERFDPEGVLLIHPGDKSFVVEMPSYVKRYHDMILRPRTVTGADGRFRLIGVQPGENVMAFNKREFVPSKRTGVRVKAGAEKNVGDVLLKEGEEAFVKVRDTNDQPVADAEVVIGAKNIVVPVDFGVRVGKTDKSGELYSLGWPAGSITVAARRSKNHPWVIAKSVNVAADVIVRLPARHHLDLTLTSEVGKSIAAPKFRLMPSPAEGVPLDMGAFGFIQWLDITDRVTRNDEGVYRIKDLNPGEYTLAVLARDHAAGKLDFKIAANATASLALKAESRFTVLVTDHLDQPVRRAKIYVQCPRGSDGRMLEVPVVAGETDKEGRLVIREGHEGKVRVSASHPAFGFAHAEAKLPVAEPVVLKMDAPGVLVGRLTEGGRAPTPGKWSVVLEPRFRDRVRGAWPDMPKMTVPDLEGNFRAQGLRPGKYRIQIVPSVSAISSPGGMIGFMMKMRVTRDLASASFEIESGNETYVDIEAIKQPDAVDGPAARISGTVLVNGRPGKGLLVSGRGPRRLGTTVGAAGQFDLGMCPVGEVDILVRDPEQAGMLDMRMEGHLWRKRVTVQEGQDVLLDISIETGRISGFVQLADGKPGSALRVEASGVTAAAEKGKPQRTAKGFALTDQGGRFTIEGLPVGTYRVRAGDRRRGYGTATRLVLQSGGVVSGVALTLTPTVTASGRIDLSALGEKRGRTFLRFKMVDGDLERSRSVRSDGTFRMSGLRAGAYEATLYASEGSEMREYAIRGRITVGGADVKDLQLALEPKPKSTTPIQQGGRGPGNRQRVRRD